MNKEVKFYPYQVEDIKITLIYLHMAIIFLIYFLIQK